MATVHLAALRSGREERLVVVKEMRPDLALEADFRRMFVEEARLAALVDHPNVVETFEAIEDPVGVYCIVMEFLDGQPLSRLRSAARREVMLPLLIHVAREVLLGLEHVHAVGLVHRDVSPQNIFVTYDGDVKLLDFGVAKATDSSVHTSVGTLKGKLGYMSPEQVLGQLVDSRTDIFAMGVLLWEALVGRRLWQDVPEPAIIGRLSSSELPRARSLKPDIPQALDDICARAMARDRADRYPTAKDFRTDLESFIARMTAKPTRKHLAQLLVSLFSQQRELLRQKIEEANAAHAMAGPTVSPPPALHAIRAPARSAPASSSAPAAASSASPIAVKARARPLLVLLAAAIILGALFGALAVATRGSSVVSNPIRGVPAEAAPMPPVQRESAPSAPAGPSSTAVLGAGSGETASASRGVGDDAPDAGTAPPRRRIVPRPKSESSDLGY